MKQTIKPTVFNGIFEELKKVSWPSRKEALHLTLIVVILSFSIGVYIGALDYVFTKLLALLLQLKK